MQIKIEIDVKPEELRRFLGLPDISGLQDDIIAFLRDKVGAAGEFDATSFVKQNLDNLRKRGPWRNLVARVLPADEPEADAAPKSTTPRRRAAKKASAPKTEVDDSTPPISEIGDG